MLGWIILGAIGCIVATAILFAGWVIGIYNMFQIGRQDIANQFSNIKTEYQRRADLFMNLVESVKAYAKFEKSTLTQVIQARGGNFGALKADQLKKMDMLDQMFSKLSVVFERYPKLKADTQFNQLNSEIRETEDRINIARTDYNGIVRDYNVLITTFPPNLVANFFGFRKELFFTPKDPKIDDAPKISMEGI
jgi:LemA protein